MLDLVHLVKDRTDASIYQQRFLEIRDRYCDYIPVCTDGSRDGSYVACGTVFPSNTEFSIYICIQINIFYRLTFVSPSFVIYRAGSSLNSDGDTKVCFFKYCPTKPIIFVGYPAMLALEVMKRQIQLDLPRAKVGVHLIGQYIFSILQDDGNGAVENNLHSVKPVLGD